MRTSGAASRLPIRNMEEVYIFPSGTVDVSRALGKIFPSALWDAKRILKGYGLSALLAHGASEEVQPPTHCGPQTPNRQRRVKIPPLSSDPERVTRPTGSRSAA